MDLIQQRERERKKKQWHYKFIHKARNYSHNKEQSKTYTLIEHKQLRRNKHMFS
jgi:hypothetical protein